MKRILAYKNPLQRAREAILGSYAFVSLMSKMGISRYWSPEIIYTILIFDGARSANVGKRQIKYNLRRICSYLLCSQWVSENML
jgi:hypothetical protein